MNHGSLRLLQGSSDGKKSFSVTVTEGSYVLSDRSLPWSTFSAIFAFTPRRFAARSKVQGTSKSAQFWQRPSGSSPLLHLILRLLQKSPVVILTIKPNGQTQVIVDTYKLWRHVGVSVVDATSWIQVLSSQRLNFITLGDSVGRLYFEIVVTVG